MYARNYGYGQFAEVNSPSRARLYAGDARRRVIVRVRRRARRAFQRPSAGDRADAHLHPRAYANAYSHAYARADAYSNFHAYPYTHAHSYTHADAHTRANAYAYSNAHARAYGDSNPHANAYGGAVGGYGQGGSRCRCTTPRTAPAGRTMTVG